MREAMRRRPSALRSMIPSSIMLLQLSPLERKSRRTEKGRANRPGPLKRVPYHGSNESVPEFFSGLLE